MTEETVAEHSIAVECYTQSDPEMGGEKPRNIRKKRNDDKDTKMVNL